ncbi:hypothetical protein [Vreelandella venusta]|uniref:Uncharacterized protein n=1 Tax=Vreelandella venusta TaxID=44935 RepID=A0AAP9ZH56_9GAMM|nr:hypothetical protein [Halomonas venusta]MBR9923478.1 hypothetical protein [Gammaproteobacteria bacterium]AZM96052.1 hypothetical protein EI420_10315 [Halomonas venusta]MDX1355697.1 hypothetical protein [Halomonas venusta]MDX1714791.1 hypothetical protein [Halomonas venusta]NPT30659.1 hypothetical protein [Halomonas venusta]
MSFKSAPFFLTALLGTALATPLLAAEQTLTLPKGASVGVEVIEEFAFSDSQSRYEAILLHPTQAGGASHQLPEYCVLVANAQLTNGRIRITTQDATCIETHDAESAIFTGSFSAGAYAADGQYGLACDEPSCTLSPGQAFVVTLDEDIDINAQDNPSAEINAARREADGEGVANPIPSDRPDPDASAENPRSVNQPE